MAGWSLSTREDLIRATTARLQERSPATLVTVVWSAFRLPHAIRSMTSLPATVFGIAERGQLRPGAWADIVVFDLEKFRDRATYQDPH